MEERTARCRQPRRGSPAARLLRESSPPPRPRPTDPTAPPPPLRRLAPLIVAHYLRSAWAVLDLLAALPLPPIRAKPSATRRSVVVDMKARCVIVRWPLLLLSWLLLGLTLAFARDPRGDECVYEQ